VRWHLASLYRKTGTSRQAELMRQLLLAPTA
jgi:DNA-binding CsgD family transcriptional regulator